MYPSSLDAPAASGAAITPSDSVDLANVSRALWVGGAGDLKLTLASGSVITLAGIVAGTLLPVRASRVWATGPVSAHRDGKRAVESATRACELSGWRDADALTVLATSCAEVGDFGAAQKWQAWALDALPDGPSKDAARALLALYQAHKPYHEPVTGAATDRRSSSQ